MPRRKQRDGVLALDLGTSSVRAVVYDRRGRMVAPTYTDLPYRVDTSASGQVSSDPDAIVRLVVRSIDGALAAARKAKLRLLAVSTSCYWHSLMGVDGRGRPTTELLTWADTRAAQETVGLRRSEDEHAYHAVTGCFFHASYCPATPGAGPSWSRFPGIYRSATGRWPTWARAACARNGSASPSGPRARCA